MPSLGLKMKTGLTVDFRNSEVLRDRFKEEKRRLQCGVYLAKKYPEYEKISTQNKLNFITGFENDLSV